MELIRTPKVENVRMLDRLSNPGASNKASGQTGPLGTFYLTATHLIFVDHEGKRETWILHSQVSHLEKQSISSVGTPLHIRCKDFRSITFVIPKERDAHDVYTSLYHLSQPLNVDDLYCFQYSASNEPFEKNRKVGWDKFDFLAEFQRQGAPNDSWVVSSINKDWEVCDTYPRHFLVPSSATKPMLIGSSRFRSRGRLPVLAYLYQNGASICRCSQPLSGFSARCDEDEMLLDCILSTKEKAKVLYVVDTRPKINAMANKAAGKGFENENFYENIKFHFFGIENIHVMRGSLQKLLEGSELKALSINAFLAALEGSGWLKHVKSVIETAAFVAKSVTEGTTVLVHCSDGWDRTAQTCSLASMLLDPYYRTYDGFQALIEKEWLAFGHKFTDRCGHIQTGDAKETAPVFTQFIDSVWQITQQFPFDFEFNEKFLLTLHEHVYSCQFGTFVGNCDKERVNLNLKDRTYSLWAYLDARRHLYINPLYEIKKSRDENEKLDGVLMPDCSAQLIRFWRQLYNRFDAGIHPRESLSELMVTSHNHINSLEYHIKYLEQRVKEQQDISKLHSTGKREAFKKESFDSIDYPLKIVKECMERLELKQLEESCDQLSNPLQPADPEVFDKTSMRLTPLCDFREERTLSTGLSDMIKEVETVAISWESFRDSKECGCGYPFDQTTARFHCYSCGRIFCVRCIDRKTCLPGHVTAVAVDAISCTEDELFGDDGKGDSVEVPVCRTCFKNINDSPPTSC
ncbi:Myotubularin-related protein 6 [Halotydeus destructor]|nr:Myotubularin-related protein 6 [Halotydeus destructor]